LEHYGRKNKFCEHISKQRGLVHLKATFLDGMLKQVGEDGRIHTNYLLFGTVTGRPSSNKPNLNNIPRSSTAADIKDIFCASDGNWLMELDGKAMEFRVWASMSNDDRMIRDIELGLDIHKAMGGVAYYQRSLPNKGDISTEQFLALTEDVTKDQRQNAKTEVVFGPMYGRGPKAISEALGISKTEAIRVLNELFKRYRKGSIYLNILKSMCKRDRFVRCLFGRKRRLPNIASPDFGVRSDAERQSINSPVQGSASDLVLMAGIRILSTIWKKACRTKLALTVYDSLIYEVPEDELQFAFEYFPKEFVKPLPELNVKLDVEVKIGKHWGSLVEVDITKPFAEEFERVKIIVEEREKQLKGNGNEKET
jgi:DNA polymerase-1